MNTITHDTLQCKVLNDIEYKTKSRLGFDENKPKKQKTKSTSKQKTLILKDYSIKENKF